MYFEDAIEDNISTHNHLTCIMLQEVKALSSYCVSNMFVLVKND